MSDEIFRDQTVTALLRVGNKTAPTLREVVARGVRGLRVVAAPARLSKRGCPTDGGKLQALAPRETDGVWRAAKRPPCL